MASIKIYNEVNGNYYTVSFEIKRTILDDGIGSLETYLLISTDIKKVDKSGFKPVTIRTLSDVPDDGGSPTATSFTDLCQRYIVYFQTAATFTQSSSSSSSEEYSSRSSLSSVEHSSNSSSSSSEGYSSEGYSSHSSPSSESSMGYSSESSSSSDLYSDGIGNLHP